MSLDRPRRIFRSSFPRLEIKGVTMVLAVGAVVAVGALLATPSRRPAARATPGEQVSASPDQISVVDAGTLRLGDRVVRLLGVEPPSHSTACSGEDCGAAAANAFAAMIRDSPVVCRIVGTDSSGRPFGLCEAGGMQLNLAVVAAGWARADGDVPNLKASELTARADKRGIWSRNPTW